MTVGYDRFMPYRTPDAANPRVRRTRERILAAARELLSEVGPAGLTYSLLAERAGVTRQTLYRHWPARPALLLGLILEGADGGYPEPGADPAAVAAAWLASLRDGLRGPGAAHRRPRRRRPGRLRPRQRPGARAAHRVRQRRPQRAAAAVGHHDQPATSTRCCPVRCWPGSSSNGGRSPTSSSPPWSPSGWPARRVRSLTQTFHHRMDDRGGRHAGKGKRGMEG